VYHIIFRFSVKFASAYGPHKFISSILDGVQVAEIELEKVGLFASRFQQVLDSAVGLFHAPGANVDLCIVREKSLGSSRNLAVRRVEMDRTNLGGFFPDASVGTSDKHHLARKVGNIIDGEA
jgi:hypothetical protein